VAAAVAAVPEAASSPQWCGHRALPTPDTFENDLCGLPGFDQ